MAFNDLVSDNISAHVRRVEILVIHQHRHIRCRKLSICCKYIHNVDLALIDCLIFETDVHIHRLLEIESIFAAERIIPILTLEEIILSAEDKLVRYRSQIRIRLDVIFVSNLLAHHQTIGVVESVHAHPAHSK